MRFYGREAPGASLSVAAGQDSEIKLDDEATLNGGPSWVVDSAPMPRSRVHSDANERARGEFDTSTSEHARASRSAQI